VNPVPKLKEEEEEEEEGGLRIQILNNSLLFLA
jgi:hypothetical protein